MCHPGSLFLPYFTYDIFNIIGRAVCYYAARLDQVLLSTLQSGIFIAVIIY